MMDVSNLVHGDLLLMTCTAVPNDLKKEAWIEEDALLYHNIVMKDNTSILAPIFLLKSQDSIWKYNYAYFQNTKRFYFVNNINAVTGGSFELVCEVDPLMTYQKAIMNCMAFESRASGVGTGYVADNRYIFNSAPVAKIFEFEESSEEGCKFDGLSYVLCVINDGQYADENNVTGKTTNEAAISNATPQAEDPMKRVLDALIVGVHEQWGYTRNTEPYGDYDHDSPHYRTEYGYADCASYISRALQAAFPNIPISYPDCRSLGEFLYNCQTILAQTQNYAKCSRVLYNESFSNYSSGTIYFNSANPDSDRATGFPSNSRPALINFGLDSTDRGKLGKAGFGHVMFYAGHLAYKPSDHSYHFWKDEYSTNPDYVDMGNDWIIHITGGSDVKRTVWDETTQKPVEMTEPETPYICKIYDNGRLAGGELPDYPAWDAKWGGQ